NATTLAVGGTETVDYTVKTLVPSSVADHTERLTLTYETNQVITLPGGRLDTCRVKSVIQRTGASVTPVSTETLHLLPGFGFVKSYYKPTDPAFFDRNQTYLTELSTTTGTLSFAAA